MGPRLLGRLTAELIARSPQFMNPLRCGAPPSPSRPCPPRPAPAAAPAHHTPRHRHLCRREYELDLRGNKINAIENLAVTKNQFDSIDLSDNAIVTLEGFPALPRLSMLLLSNNRVARLNAQNLERSIPGLETLVLTNNRFSRLEDLEGLARLPKLRQLSLVDNPVAKVKNYRLFVVHMLPALRWLDFRRVKEAERAEAAKLAEAGAFGEAALRESGRVFVPGEGVPEEAAGEGEGAGEGGPARATKPPTEAELMAVKAAIANASTMAEVEALEQALRTGEVPSHLKEGGGDVEMAD